VECGGGIIPGAHQTDGISLKREDQTSIHRAFEGERRIVTILFADIVGSTRLIEEMEPDQAASRLYGVLNYMADAVRRFGGTVNKMQGDGLMALFGAPMPHEDHAVRACCAALAMRETLSQLGSTTIRIGIHSGEAVVQMISNDLSNQYDAMGIAVHIAARMEQAADSSAIVLTLATLNAARGMIDVESLGPRVLKGLSQPIELFSLQDVRSVAASQQFLGRSTLSSFVGRAAELLKLNRAFDKALAASSPVVGIVGEAGCGKSRLAFEFVMSCRRKNIPIIEARATSHEQVMPLRPVLEFARSFFSISKQDSAKSARSKVNSRLAGLGLIADGPMLMDFLGIRDSSQKPVGPVEHQELLAAFGRISSIVGTLGPAVAVFEDLHWLDAASHPFIDEIIRGLVGSNVLVLLSFRPGHYQTWMDDDFYEEITLQPLSTHAMEALASELLGSDGTTTAIRDQIIDRAAGNPFFAEELIGAFTDQGALRGVSGNYRRISGIAVQALPDTVRGVIGFRIDRLGVEEKLFLEAASVIGREFPVAAVADVVGIEVSGARTCASSLLELGMLYEHASGGMIAFKHPLIQEVTYASLVVERRRSLHRRAAAALASQFASSAQEHAALVAHHWDEGGEPMQAAANYMVAAHWTAPRNPAQASRTWERVRQMTMAMPEAPNVNYMRLLACGQIINLSWRESAAIERLQPIYEEASGLAKQQKDVRAAALITLAYGRALLATGSADDYLAYIEEAQMMLSEKRNESVQAMLAAVQSHAVGQAGFLHRALSMNEEALKTVDKIDPTDRRMLGFDPRHWLSALRARYLLLTNDAVGAERQLEQILRDEFENTDAVHRAVALGICVDGAALERNAARALLFAEQLNEISTMKNVSSYLSVLTNYFFGVALLAAHDCDAAQRQLQKALTIAHDRRAGLELEPLILANLAEASREETTAKRLELAERARRLAHQRTLRVSELFAISSIIRVQTMASSSINHHLRSDFDHLVELTGASRLRLRVENLPRQ
jgi:adenylate cyclase